MKDKKYPRVIKFKEKYGDSYYLANTKEEISKIWLLVLTERDAEGWYNWMKDYVPYDFKKAEYTQQDVDALPESMAEEKARMLKVLKAEAKELKEQREIRQNYNDIQLAIAKEDAALAYRLIDTFSDNEYEGFEEIDLITVN